MKIFIELISKIFKQWIIYLGLIPTIYDYLNAYFNIEYKFPHSIIIGSPIAMFLYVFYKVYADEYKEREALEQKLKGPTNYIITAILHPIDFKKEKLIKQFDNIKLEAEKRLSSIPPFMEVYEVEKYLQAIHIMSVPTGFNTKSASEYNQELSIYKSNLEEILFNIEGLKEKVDKRIDELREKFYFIEFYIENIGITSDSDIQVQLNCLNKNIVFPEAEIISHGMDIYKLIPEFPELPEKPKIQDVIQQLNVSTKQFDLNMPHLDIFNPHAFRQQIEIKDNNCVVTIRDLHVGDKVDLFKNKLILMKNNNDIVFEVTIKSKKSTQVLKPKVIVNIEKSAKSLFYYGDNS